MSDRIPIAERTIFAVDKDGREFEIRAAVGVPYEAESGSWACPVCLEGFRNFPDMYGVDYDPTFFDRADARIHLSNSQITGGIGPGKVRCLYTPNRCTKPS